MTRTLLIASFAVVALVAIALAAPEPKDKKTLAAHHHGPHVHGHTKPRKPRSAEPAAYEPVYEGGDDDYAIDYQPDYYIGYGDANEDYYYGQYGQYGRRLRGPRTRGPGRGFGGRRGFRRLPAGRRGRAFYPLVDYPLYQYQYVYPNYAQYIDNDSDYDRDYDKKERVKKDADKHRVKKDASSILDKISSVFKPVKQ
ncbi:hypothetical protein AAVH_04308 [Aphelenchoides avenae]|nr:hypothetical protein AAVH_04308 [Aphelenchus avenae]